MSGPSYSDIPAPDSIILDRALRILLEIGMSQPPDVIAEYNRRAAALKEGANAKDNIHASTELTAISQPHGNGNGRTAARRPRPHQRPVHLDHPLRQDILRGKHDAARGLDSGSKGARDKSEPPQAS